MKMRASEAIMTNAEEMSSDYLGDEEHTSHSSSPVDSPCSSPGASASVSGSVESKELLYSLKVMYKRKEVSILVIK